MRVFDPKKGFVESSSPGRYSVAINPSPAELSAIASYFGISSAQLTELFQEERRPRVIVFPTCKVVGFASLSIKGPRREHVSLLTLVGVQGTAIISKKQPESLPRVEKVIQANPKIVDRSVLLTAELFEECINDYYAALDQLGIEIDAAEKRVLEKPELVDIKKLFELKRSILKLRRDVAANREVLSIFIRLPEIKKDEVLKYEHVISDSREVLDLLVVYREMLTGLTDIYVSSISNALNNVVKKLTAYGSLVLVPTLIASIYGMNFQHMPEIGWKLGYPFSLALMVVSIIALVIFFSRKNWL